LRILNYKIAEKWLQFQFGYIRTPFMVKQARISFGCKKKDNEKKLPNFARR
jgi:hypothetical protein